MIRLFIALVCALFALTATAGTPNVPTPAKDARNAAYVTLASKHKAAIQACPRQPLADNAKCQAAADGARQVDRDAADAAYEANKGPEVAALAAAAADVRAAEQACRGSPDHQACERAAKDAKHKSK